MPRTICAGPVAGLLEVVDANKCGPAEVAIRDTTKATCKGGVVRPHRVIAGQVFYRCHRCELDCSFMQGTTPYKKDPGVCHLVDDRTDTAPNGDLSYFYKCEPKVVNGNQLYFANQCCPPAFPRPCKMALGLMRCCPKGCDCGKDGNNNVCQHQDGNRGPFPANAVGDPHFAGISGGSFEVSGQGGNAYSIVSDADFSLNSRFFAEGNGNTFLGNTGIVSGSDGVELHRTGNMTLNGEPWEPDFEVYSFQGSFAPTTVQRLRPGLELAPEGGETCHERKTPDADYWVQVVDMWSERVCMDAQGRFNYFHSLEDCTFARHNSDLYPCWTSSWLRQVGDNDVLIERKVHAWEVKTTRFTFQIETRLGVQNTDIFLRYNEEAEAATLWPLPHGILGQTADGIKRIWQGSDGEGAIEGVPADYILSKNDLTGTDFIYSRYQQEVFLNHGPKAGSRKLRSLLPDEEEDLHYLQAKASVGGDHMGGVGLKAGLDFIVHQVELV